MYDLVNGKFYASDSNASFSAGPEIIDVSDDIGGSDGD
jgi:hypothetical protein